MRHYRMQDIINVTLYAVRQLLYLERVNVNPVVSATHKQV
jgi:hypothetical protein